MKKMELLNLGKTEKMETDDLVSVIMPVYNSESFLSQSLDSVIFQTYKNLELLPIDDFSRDSSRDILKKYSEKDPRIKPIFKTENSGSADSRNFGIRKAEGRYIAFLDSDDLWDPEFLEKQLNFMKKHNSAFSFSSYRIIGEDNREILKPFIVKKLKISYYDNLFYNSVGQLTAVYDSAVLGKMYFDVSLKSVRDDYALWLDILKKTDFGFGNPEILASYRIRKGAVTANKKKLILPHYRMLRNREKLSVIKAAFFTLVWGILGIRKYFLNRID